MELNSKEGSDGKLWLLCAGGCALALSFFVWRVDEYMVGASAREHKHNIMMNELRAAQSGLVAGSVDNRQALPLTIEGGKQEAELPHDVAADAAHHGDHHGHDDHGHDDHGHGGGHH